MLDCGGISGRRAYDHCAAPEQACEGFGFVSAAVHHHEFGFGSRAYFGHRGLQGCGHGAVAVGIDGNRGRPEKECQTEKQFQIA